LTPAGRHVRVGRKIRGGVEADRRVASLVPAELVVVLERMTCAAATSAEVAR
jgi:hypothetical protein